jgi:hypothetical protein
VTVAHAFWLRAPGCGEIRPVRLRKPGHDEVLVRTLRSGISRGTERLVFRGGVPPDQRATMRAPFQEGNFPGPVKYGYLNVGAVEEGPAELLGRTVFCLYPHQTAYVVPAGAVSVVPDGIPAARAVLAGTVETAEHARREQRDEGQRQRDVAAVDQREVEAVDQEWPEPQAAQRQVGRVAGKTQNQDAPGAGDREQVRETCERLAPGGFAPVSAGYHWRLVDEKEDQHPRQHAQRRQHEEAGAPALVLHHPGKRRAGKQEPEAAHSQADA